MGLSKSSRSERAMVVGALVCLRSLVAWDRAIELLGALEDCLDTGAGLTQREIDRSIRWSTRLAKMDERLVDFYTSHAPVDETASVAFWRVLEGGPTLEGWQYRKLKDLWCDSYGHVPAIELCPRFN